MTPSTIRLRRAILRGQVRGLAVRLRALRRLRPGGRLLITAREAARLVDAIHRLRRLHGRLLRGTD